MGKKSRQKKLRRELRPLMQAAVAKARADAQSALKNQVLVPQAHQRVSQVKHEVENRSLLVMPTPKAVAAIEKSRA